jgi:predicted AAA+ superfamily ATPase
MKEVISGKILDSLSSPVPDFTERDVYLPEIKGKAVAIIGMRRSGKTTLMWQLISKKLEKGIPRKNLLYLNFEDERLDEMKTSDLQWIVEEYFKYNPGSRGTKGVAFFLDEIQRISGWETFIRRLLDEEKIEIFLSGSSSKLLSREIATSMRGRALESILFPFSFREYLRHNRLEPADSWESMSKKTRTLLNSKLSGYLEQGGFPEAQGISSRDREMLLTGYIDIALLRDVIERYSISNPTALRWLIRHLLMNAAGFFSINKMYNTMKSQGLSVSKDTLHEYLGHLEDAFLIQTLSIFTSSEKQRMVNPMKAYPIDPGLISIYDVTGKKNTGSRLETSIMLELLRRGCTVNYFKTAEGYEVDFLVRTPEKEILLFQTCSDITDKETFTREIRALQSASKELADATPILITLDAIPPTGLPAGITWIPVVEWLLQNKI